MTSTKMTVMMMMTMTGDYVLEGCPGGEHYIEAGNSSVTKSPYSNDLSVMGGLIALFVLLGFALLNLFESQQSQKASQLFQC